MSREQHPIPAFVVVTVAAVLLRADAARPCGGPDIFVPTASVHISPASIATDPWESTDLEPFRFLDPFRLAHAAGAADLAALAYGAPDDAHAPATASMSAATPSPTPRAPPQDDGINPGSIRAAIARGDWAAAKKTSRALIDHVLSLPTPAANNDAADLRFAVEVAEIEPSLHGLDAHEVEHALYDDALPVAPITAAVLVEDRAIRAAKFADAAQTLAAHPRSPRRPSLELAVLRNRITTELPSGWPPLAGVAPSTWASLLDGHDKWIANHADHPLVDLARLQKLRVLYLKGDGDAAWKLLFDLYQRRPQRALWEMRHLLLNNLAPADALVDAVADPVLATALVRSSTPLAPDAWSAQWRRAEKALDGSAGKPGQAAWAENLEERLLLQTALDEKPVLPPAFPATARKANDRWKRLRTIALIRAGKGDDAAAQAALIDGKASETATVIASAWLAARQPARAAQTPGLDEDTARYLFYVTIDDADLAAIARAPNANVNANARIAAHALALRKLAAGPNVDDGAGDWTGGAAVLDDADPKRAALWREAATLAGDASASGRAKLARWLLAHRGALFDRLSNSASRGLKYMLRTDTPEAREKRDVVQQRRLLLWLLAGGEQQQALAAFGAALALDPHAKEARSTLHAADAAYNALINADYAQSQAYVGALDDTVAVKRVRAAGEIVRAKH